MFLCLSAAILPNFHPEFGSLVLCDNFIWIQKSSLPSVILLLSLHFLLINDNICINYQNLHNSYSFWYNIYIEIVFAEDSSFCQCLNIAYFVITAVFSYSIFIEVNGELRICNNAEIEEDTMRNSIESQMCKG